MKPVTLTIDKVETVAYDKHHKPLLMTRMQRRRPGFLSVKMIPFKESMSKVILWAVRGHPSNLQVFYYSNEPSYVYLAARGEIVMIPEEYAGAVMYALRAFLDPTVPRPIRTDDRRNRT